MSSSQQPFFANNQANLNNIVAAQNRLFSGFEQLVDLNLQAFKSSLDDIAEKTQQVASLNDVEQANQFAIGLAKPSSDQALHYGKQLFDIVSGVQRDLGQIAEAQITQNQQQITQLVEQAEKSAPAGSESFFALFKASVLNATNAADGVVKATRQFTEATESNVAAASSAAANVSQQAAGAVEKTIARAATAASQPRTAS
ncbi:phasin family protein [Paenalcaligenes niemegkensis]|uniref:phasin family protein n=1 Tax=Paenalcaligenes niemegkensis TaxID=2895469 RepID=UPI001EE7B08B|nr:phasin family protein [Paenalcaligenes niemegkensis]MCQ9617098.1 phasin family protein [Paenalcaligenes niemegkensis]